MGNLGEIELAVGALSAAELQELQARIDLRLAGETRSLRLTTQEQTVWDAVNEVCRTRAIPPAKFAQAYGVGNFRRALADVNAYIDTSCGAGLPLAHRRVVIRTVLECLVEYIQSWKTPLAPSPKTLLDTVGRLAHAVDQCFPGYADAKMLHRVVARAA